MKENKITKEEQFDYFLNKTIVYTSMTYFKKQMHIQSKESFIDNSSDDFNALLQDFAAFDKIEQKIEIESYKNCLSQIEQSVLFLLFNEQLTQSEAAKILNVYSKTISKIKLRAIKKLKKSMKEDDKNEK